MGKCCVRFKSLEDLDDGGGRGELLSHRDCNTQSMLAISTESRRRRSGQTSCPP